MNVDMLRRHLAALRIHPDGVKYVIASGLAPPQMLLRSGPQHNLTGDIATTLCTYLDDAVKGDVVPRWQVSSLLAERAFLVDLEYRGGVVLALNHPLPVPLTITNKRGRHQRVEYTPDALVVDDKSVQVIELKTDGEADELVKARPYDWRKTAEGYEYTTARMYFESIGLQYAVVVSSSLPWIRTRNQQFLARQSDPEPNGAVDRRIISYVRRHSPASLDMIIAACNLTTAGPILRLIKGATLHVDLDHALLSSPDSAFVCISAAQACAAARGFASIQATAGTQATVPVSATADPRHLDKLGERIITVQGGTYNDGSDWTPSRRTKQRWAKAFRTGGAIALNPKWSRCGRRGSRVSDWHEKLLVTCIASARGSGTRPSRVTAFGTYEKALKKVARQHRCQERHIHYSMFCKLWKQRDHCTKDAMSRGGRRLANAVEPYGDVDTQMVLADGPFQVAHIDHCLAPSYTKDGKGATGKPWLTILVDDWKGEPLARVLTNKYPSHRTDLALLRDCVRRHGRLPHTIFSDHGSDFMGRVFIGALAAFGVSSLFRPETDPRVGHRVERTFGTFATTVCQGYEGFAFDIPNARAASKKKHPSLGPKRDLSDLQRHVDHLLFEVIPTLKPLDGSDSKLDARLKFEKTYGRQGVPINADLTFLIVTAPPLKERGCIEPSGAIRVADQRFYAPALIDIDVRVRDLSLRREPEDPAVLYFVLDGQWHVAKSRDARKSHGRSDESIRAEAQRQKRPTAKDRAERRRALHSRPRRSRGQPRPTRSAKSTHRPTKNISQRQVHAAKASRPLSTLPLPFDVRV